MRDDANDSLTADKELGIYFKGGQAGHPVTLSRCPTKYLNFENRIKRWNFTTYVYLCINI